MKITFKSQYLKKSFLVFAILIVILFCNFITNASIIDDIKNVFGISSEKAQGTESAITLSNLIDDELESGLTDDEKEVVDEISNVVDSIRRVDLDEIWGTIGDGLKGVDKDDITAFFDEYPESLNSVKIFISRLNVKITDIKTENGIIYTHITIDHPSLKEIVSIIMPEVLLNNAGAFINNNITNENVNSILNSIRKAVEKNNISRDELNLDIEFKKSNGRWVIFNGNKISKELENHFNDIAGEITRNIR